MNSNSNKNSQGRGGMGIGGWLLILFVGLKLTGHIGWSWWWVLSPLWIAGLFALLCLAIALIVAFATER